VLLFLLCHVAVVSKLLWRLLLLQQRATAVVNSPLATPSDRQLVPLLLRLLSLCSCCRFTNELLRSVPR
jgi:hypothetical protein